MKFSNISIKWQFVVIVSLIAMPFILLSLYNLAEDKKKESDRARNMAISIARNIGMQQKSSEAYTRQMLTLISKLPEMQETLPDQEVLNHLFKSVLSDNPQFAVVLAVLPNGDAYASAIPFNPFSVSDRKYFKDIHRTHAFSVGEFAKSRLTNRAVLHYAMPVLDKKDSIKLILIASFDLAQYHNLLSVSALPKGSDFSFYDYSGRMLYHSQSQQKLIGKRGSAEVQNAILAVTDEGSYFARDDAGNERLYGFVRINIEKDSPYMYIVVSTPLSQAFSDANKVFYRNIILTILAIVFSIFIFLYYRNYIFRNIEKLVEVANKLKDGDLTTRTNMDYSAGETGTLAHAFDKMAESLLFRENEKDSINKNLRVITERLEIAVNSAHIGIWEWDLLTHKVYWNSQMYELYHLNESNFKGTIPDWMKFLHPEDAAQFEEELHHAIRFKKNHKTSYRIKAQHKGYKNIRCYFTIICDLKGKPLHITGINIDYTERVFLENELAHTKGLLAAKTNDLRTSLTSTINEMETEHKKISHKLENTYEFNSESTRELKSLIFSWQNSIRRELEEILKKL